MPDIANDNHPLSRQRLAVQPRGLRRGDAAAYLGISPSHFDKQRAAGAIPPPRQMLGVVLWDRNDLDRLFDGGQSSTDANNDNEWDSVLAPSETETRSRLH